MKSEAAAETDRTAAGCPRYDQRLVRPRRETLKWRRLARLLDSINEEQDRAIHRGFVKGKTRDLDDALAKIHDAAREARELLRPNVEVMREDNPNNQL